MSIRFLKADNVTPVTFNRVEDLFDPRLNQNFRDDPYDSNSILAHDWIKQLTALFSRENLVARDNFKVLMFESSQPSEAEMALFINNYLPAVADEDLFVFAWLRRSGRITERGSYFRIMWPGRGTQYDSTVFMPEFDQKTLEYHDPENFAQWIKATADKWREQLSRVALTAFWPAHSQFHCNYVMQNFCYYTTGAKIFRTPGRTLRPKQVLDMLAQGDGNELVVDILPNREVHLKVVIKVTKTNRQPIYTVLNYSANVLDLLPYPNMEKKEKDPVLVGVELECATDYTIKELVDAADYPFFAGKQDSSISGTKRNKIELVTAPSSIKYLKRQYALWFNKLDYTKFDTSVNTNNGMHVHIGREHFEDNTHIRNFCWFLNNPANSEFLVYISERGSYQAMQQYSPFYHFNEGTTRTRAFREAYVWLSSGFRGITNFKGGWEQGKTLEVRMFRGVVSFASIVKNLEFVESVFEFTKGLTSYRELTLQGYLNFLKKTPGNRFPLLKKFIDQGDVGKMMAASEVKDVIFIERAEEKIVDLLSKSKLKLTHEHISYLNRGKKRTYTLNKETGQLELTFHNRSKLHAFDKSFAERYLRNVNAA